MKHRVLLISIIGVAMGSLFMQPVYALDKKALGDSLTVYANRFARVGKVKVEKVRVNQDRADIYTNPTLGYLSLTQEQIDTFRLIASKAIYGDQGGECYIHIKDGYELEKYSRLTGLEPFDLLKTLKFDDEEISIILDRYKDTFKPQEKAFSLELQTV